MSLRQIQFAMGELFKMNLMQGKEACCSKCGNTGKWDTYYRKERHKQLPLKEWLEHQCLGCGFSVNTNTIDSREERT